MAAMENDILTILAAASGSLEIMLISNLSQKGQGKAVSAEKGETSPKVIVPNPEGLIIANSKNTMNNIATREEGKNFTILNFNLGRRSKIAAAT